MHHRHMAGRHRGAFSCFIRFIFILLLIGVVVHLNGQRGRSTYRQGFRDGAQSVVGAAGSEAAGVVALDGMRPPMAGTQDFTGLGLGAFLLAAVCGVALLGFFGLLFTAARFAGRAGRHGKWGGPPHARAVDEDEIGPEKDPSDYL